MTIIRDNTIKFGAPNEFNDPFECMSVVGIISFAHTKRDLEARSGKRYTDEAVKKNFDEIVSYSHDSFGKKSLAKYGILCLSGTWDDVLMWAHYSNDHKGIIAIFQFDRDEDLYSRMMKVQYKKGITYFELDHANCEKKIWESFSTKDSVWAYENEYRVINPPSKPHAYDGSGIKPFPKELLKGFIFGCRIFKDVRERIINMVEKHYPALTLFDMILDNSEIKLHKVLIKRSSIAT